jgi:glucose-6-phosphate 1-dehydrogenase
VRAKASGKTAIVIFGASGDLTSRKIVPALHSLRSAGLLSNSVQVIGVARSELPEAAFREKLSKGIAEYSRLQSETKKEWPASAEDLVYIAGEYDDPETYHRVAEELSKSNKDSGPMNRLFYLATPAEVFQHVIKHLGESGLNDSVKGWRRIIVEKPFGRDRKSARRLNEQLHEVFEEDQIYRIDHYLGKETVQNIIAIRFANAIFEPLWNRNYVDHMQITMAEDIGIENRAGYYEQTGVVRDMVQNHLFQLLTLAAMEPPNAFNAQSLRDEKVKVLDAVSRPSTHDVVWGQYDGYRREKGVAKESRTPTFVALKLYVDNWRWRGVPFYLRTGKTLARKATEISLKFKSVPLRLFPEDKDVSPNRISLCIQPDEGIHMRFETMVPGMGSRTAPADMIFHYNRFGNNVIPDAYERLLLDAMNGDPSLFVRGDFEDRAWELLDPLLDVSEHPSDHTRILHAYEPGSWGPHAADLLMTRDGRAWQLSCSSD